MAASPSSGPLHVVVAGGGVAGLEALIGLRRLAGDRVALTLVAPDPDFVYKPMVVGEPFGAGEAEHRALGPIADELGADWVQEPVTGVELDERAVELGDGRRLAYDALAVCVGARTRPALRHAATFDATGPMLDLEGMLAELARTAEPRLAFVVPPGVSWPLPLYEIALMAHRRAGELGLGARFTIVTPESRPLGIFGTVASDEVARLLAGRGIELRTDTQAHDDESGVVLTPGGERLEAEAIVALPALGGPAVAGLPADDQGFVAIDADCRVRGADRAWAAGDGTTFPVKQGGLATQQADAVAEQIAALAGAPVEPAPFRPVLRGMLLTGEESLYARHDLRGGTGEGEASLDYLWWPPHKIGGRFLAPWLAHEEPHEGLDPPRRPIEVEVALPHEWHERPFGYDVD